jgi:transposase InsO family protein
MASTPLPRGWTKHVKSALLHAISLASMALTVARSRRAGDRVQLERAINEIALLKEELGIKDARWSRLSSRKRPRYSPIQRLRILQLKAARGWSLEQAAQTFMIDVQTLFSWMRRVDEEGESALLQVSEPVNKFPDFVRYLVKQLKVLCPTMGKVRIAEVLARAGLHLGATTVGRILKYREPVPEEVALDVIEIRRVTAKHPDDVWHVDLTVVPTGAGFWVPWLPFALAQSWPFCWWVAVVVDHFSRAMIGFAVFSAPPTASEVQRTLNRAVRGSGRKPKYIIADKGKQFWCRSFKRWCRRRSIRARFGAVGEHGSIAIVERFIRSMKNEYTSRILVPLRLESMRHELACYSTWYNRYRPSQALRGRTPWEAYTDLWSANAKPRFEPRENWPAQAHRASPRTTVRGKRGTKLALVVGYVEDRRHLPVVELRQAA